MLQNPRNAQKRNNNEFEQALELNATNGEESDTIEIKNEDFSSGIDTYPLNSYNSIIHLNLSMNKISTIQGSLDCPLL